MYKFAAETHKIDQRLQQLKVEFESGQKMLADLESQQANLKVTLLRISGAIQVLEELQNQEKEEENAEIADNNHTPEGEKTLSHRD